MNSLNKNSTKPLLALLFSIVTVLFLFGCGGGDSNAGGGGPAIVAPLTYNATLSSAEEVPPLVSSATGSGSVVVDPTTRAISGSISFSGITVTNAHIHQATVGVSGGIIIGLTVNSNTATVPTGAVLTETQFQALQAGNLYFNVHSSANPTGEIRGQIGRIVRFASLTGSQEAPTPVTTTAATGTGFVVVDPATRAISGSVSFTGLTATNAHIHQAAAGVAGGIIVGLTVNGNTATVPAGAILTETQFQAFEEGNLYFNVHSAANPAGEIRGQIGNVAATASLNGAQEVPPLTTSATGIGSLFVDPVTRAVFGGVSFSGITATNAHIHQAAVGVSGGIIVGLTLNGNTATVPTGTVLTEAQFQALQAGNLYFNVHTAANPTGEIRGQISVRYASVNSSGNNPPVPQPTAATLTSIQNTIFTPTCAVSGCHSGQNPPQGLRLDAGFSYANLVNVASPYSAGLTRVVPNSPNTSFLIQKLEGTQSFGGLMPQGGPLLPQNTVDQVRAWINAGALDN